MHRIGFNSSRLPEPESLKTLASGVKYPNGNNLLHQFVLDYSGPNDSSAQNYIHAVLRSLSGISSNARNRDGFTALHLAVRKRKYLMVRKLISCLPDIDVNARSERNGRTALHLAISLLGDGNFSKVAYHTTLPAEVIQEITNIIEFLISSGADLDACDFNGACPLREAVRSGHFDTVRLLVEKGSAVEGNSRSGDTPLYVAVERNETDIVKFLISRGANVNSLTILGGSPLRKAVKACSLEIAKVLLESGALLHIHDDQKITPIGDTKDNFRLFDRFPHSNTPHIINIHHDLLHDAVETKCLEMVKILVESGANLNGTNHKGDTPLHVAVKLKQIEIVKFLIKSGANANAVNVDVKDGGNTPLHFAAREEQTDTVTFLIESGADLNALNGILDSPLHNAVEAGNLETVKVLVERGANVNVKNSKNDTPLHSGFTLQALTRGEIEIVKFLISRSADLNDLGGMGSPLHYAALSECFEVVKMLIESGAVVDLKNRNTDTPLHFAVTRQQIETVVFLIDHGADVNAIGNYGKTPLHKAVEAGNLETVKVLVERGAVVNAKNSENDTPLHSGLDRWKVWARDKIEIVKFLISRGADLNALGERGSSLHYAARSECFEVVKILVESGAVVDLRNHVNITPLHFAARRKRNETVGFLIDHGADVNAVCDFGKTPLYYAGEYDGQVSRYRSVGTVKLLVERGAKGEYDCAPLAHDPVRTKILPRHGAYSNDVRKFGHETPPERAHHRRNDESDGGSGLKRQKWAKN